MAEVINLRRARKAHTRKAAEATATLNRAAFGRSRAEREAAAVDAARLERGLDGAKRGE